VRRTTGCPGGGPSTDRAYFHGNSRLGPHADPRGPGSLDHEVGRGTIANILREHGLESAPELLKKTTWTESLKTHWDVLTAADFFTVDVWTSSGLTRFAVLFLIELSTRRVEIACHHWREKAAQFRTCTRSRSVRSAAV
jgi:hypothetical protein